MRHRRSPQADADLDAIWLFVARESGSLAAADRLIDDIAERFLLLAAFHRRGGLGTASLASADGAGRQMIM